MVNALFARNVTAASRARQSCPPSRAPPMPLTSFLSASDSPPAVQTLTLNSTIVYGQRLAKHRYTDTHSSLESHTVAMALKRINKELTDLGRYVCTSSHAICGIRSCRG